jgi:hypothetical protein
MFAVYLIVGFALMGALLKTAVNSAKPDSVKQREWDIAQANGPGGSRIGMVIAAVATIAIVVFIVVNFGPARG